MSCSSSLLDGCDEPEILPYENLNSVPRVLTSHNLLRGLLHVLCLRFHVGLRYSLPTTTDWADIRMMENETDGGGRAAAMTKASNG